MIPGDSKFCSFCGTRLKRSPGNSNPAFEDGEKGFAGDGFARYKPALVVIVRYIILPVVIMAGLYFLLAYFLDGKVVASKAVMTGLTVLIGFSFLFLLLEVLRGFVMLYKIVTHENG